MITHARLRAVSMFTHAWLRAVNMFTHAWLRAVNMFTHACELWPLIESNQCTCDKAVLFLRGCKGWPDEPELSKANYKEVLKNNFRCIRREFFYFYQNFSTHVIDCWMSLWISHKKERVVKRVLKELLLPVIIYYYRLGYWFQIDTKCLLLPVSLVC